MPTIEWPKRIGQRAGAWRLALIFLVLLLPSAAQAEADGPDFFRITGLRAGTNVGVRAEPNARAAKLGELPYNADGIRNLGCRGGLTFAEWEKATPREREAARLRRWCRVEWRNLNGWVAGRYLAEGSRPKTATGGGARLFDRRWVLRSSPAGDAVGDAWIEFTAGGEIAGNSGCNGFRGRADITANGIRAAPLAITRMACPPPADRQEAAILGMLSRPLTYQIRDDRLSLRATDGEHELQFGVHGD